MRYLTQARAVYGTSSQKDGAGIGHFKRDNESDLDYHKRIIYGKLADKTLGDIDYAELSEAAYGQQYSSDVARECSTEVRELLI